jgi:hypothetical protein
MINARKGAAEGAEALAIQALTFLADEVDRLGRFLAATGIGGEEIRRAAREPAFLAGVLEYLLSDETLLLSFSTKASIDPADVARAHAALAGQRWERDVP